MPSKAGRAVYFKNRNERTDMDGKLLPEEFLNEMKALLGSEYEDYLASLKEPWRPGLRVNTLKAEPEEVNQLLGWDLKPVSWVREGFYYHPALRPARHPAYYAGLYYLQEPSAMTPGALLPVKPGQRILDLCAAPGGKSTQLAARLQGYGLLVSNDASASRARALLKNLELAGAANICVTAETPQRLAQAFPEFFDGVLVDAPCSGEGMFRRDESMVKDWLLKGPDYYAPIQREILAQAVGLVKPGGLILYSTCTFSPREDEGTVEAILQQFPQMELVPLEPSLVLGAAESRRLPGALRLFPHRLAGEGHFLALLKKTGQTGKMAVGEGRDLAGAGAGGTKARRRGGRLGDGGRKGARGAGSRETGASFASSSQEAKIGPEAAEFMARCGLSPREERLKRVGEDIYLLPEGLEPPGALHYLRTGLFLGTEKKGRFEPSQALAMALLSGQYPDRAEFSMEDPWVLRYLKGETLPWSGQGTGWRLVCAQGWPLGWAKAAGTSLKNKYYPGWRWQ